MRNSKNLVQQWGLAALLMASIFALSSRPPASIPQFGWADSVVKKGGHMLGYGLLTVLYWRAMGWSPRNAVLAWALALVYGMTDELHQALVPGRHASLADVFLFDASGGALGLLISGSWRSRRPSTRNAS